MNTLNIYIVINMRAHIHIESIGCEKTIHVYLQRSDGEKRDESVQYYCTCRVIFIIRLSLFSPIRQREEKKKKKKKRDQRISYHSKVIELYL
jgi:hypothetical protein